MKFFTVGLSLLMFSMGITLTINDFVRVFQKPGVVGTSPPEIKQMHRFNRHCIREYCAFASCSGTVESMNECFLWSRCATCAGLGFLACYAVMPLLAYALAMAFNLPPALLAGLVLVGSINGGQASNLCTYIAKGTPANARTTH